LSGHKAAGDLHLVFSRRSRKWLIIFRWRRKTTTGLLFVAALAVVGLTTLSSGQPPGPGQGVPRNPNNPFYKQTKAAANPQGFNPDGDRFVDLGLGAILYPQRNLPAGNVGSGADGRGDFLPADGEFRVPSLRNVDKRPSPGFVKCYMHNGVFKSLKQVVDFYNTRNLTTQGEVSDLTAGHPGARVGNLGLTSQEEDDLVAFLQTLSDGYFSPARRRPPQN
jgi:cytochrome c peroxidase